MVKCSTKKRIFSILFVLLCSSIGLLAPTFSVGAKAAFVVPFNTFVSSAQSTFAFDKSKTTIYLHINSNLGERFYINSISPNESSCYRFFFFYVPMGTYYDIYQVAICPKGSTLNADQVVMNASNSTLTAFSYQINTAEYYKFAMRYGTVSGNNPAWNVRSNSSSSRVNIVSGALYDYDIRWVVAVSSLVNLELTTYCFEDVSGNTVLNPSLSWQNYVDDDSVLSDYFDSNFSNAGSLDDQYSDDQEFTTEEESTTDSDQSTTNSKDNPLSPDYTGQWTNGNSEPVNDFSSVNNNEFYSKINQLISGVDSASSLMESNLSEMSDNFSAVNSTLTSIFSIFPPVIIGLIVCAVLMLICIKVLGR